MEAQVIRTYLQWVSELPWSTRSEDSLDLEFAERVSSKRTTTGSRT